LYRPTPERFYPLFDAAPLDFAPRMAMKVVPGDVISDAIALTGIYDLNLTRWLVKIARNEGGVFVDVGANVGYFCLIWSAQHERNRTVAFEPSPTCFELLKRNVTENALQDRISVRCEAVANCHGSMQFDLGDADQTGWGGLTLEASGGSVAVDVVTLDEALSSSAEIRVLKVDAQGADLLVLRGAERLLRGRSVHHVRWKECKWRMGQFGIAVGEAEAFMRSVGYEPIALDDAGAEIVRWYAQPRHR
jgi:FkbM family methyltransferase